MNYSDESSFGSISNAETVFKTVSQQESMSRVYIQLTSNNTILTLTDSNGKTLAWSSCGSVGFKGG